MTRIEKILKQDEERLMYLYAKANTKSKKKKISHDLFSFSSMYYSLFGLYGDFFGKMMID